MIITGKMGSLQVWLYESKKILSGIIEESGHYDHIYKRTNTVVQKNSNYINNRKDDSKANTYYKSL